MGTIGKEVGSNITTKHPGNPNTNFTIIGNAIFFDKEVSWAAKGLFCQLCSVPKEHFQVSKEGLVKMARTGRDGTASALKELEEHGYVTRERMHKFDGSRSWDMYIIDRDPKGIFEKAVTEEAPAKWDWDEPQAEKKPNPLDDWDDDDWNPVKPNPLDDWDKPF